MKSVNHYFHHPIKSNLKKQDQIFLIGTTEFDRQIFIDPFKIVLQIKQLLTFFGNTLFQFLTKQLPIHSSLIHNPSAPDFFCIE